MNLPKIESLDVSDKRVIVRGDLDVGLTGDDFRLAAMAPTLEYLAERKAIITIIGHKGRPTHKATAGETAQFNESLSLEGVAKRLDGILGLKAVVMENLRFNPGEEANDPEFAKSLAKHGEIYINEAFAASHRMHASIVGLPKLLPHAAGFRFVEEVENLSRVFENPKKPVVVIIGGVKEDKIPFIEEFKGFADKILVGGRLPAFLGEEEKSIRSVRPDEKIVIANLIMDKEDITLHSIERFAGEIEKAGTIVLVGPMGKFEEEGHRQGTKAVFETVANSSAFKVAGGGDTVAAIETLGLKEKFDWISVGGGAMLEFLAKRTLPGIEALLH